MKLFVAIFLAIIATAVSFEPEETLEVSKVYNVFPIDNDQVKIVNGLGEKLPGLDIWQPAFIEGREARILVPEYLQTTFIGILESGNIKHEISIKDVKQVIEQEVRHNDKARSISLESGRISFTSYNRHAEINTYLDGLASKYPGLVKVETLGKSTEGRDIKVIRISKSGGTDIRKPVIISDAGIHAREWIAPATALYIITKLVEDVTESDVVDKVDWVIVPLLNPDGYEYSFTNSNTRLWRKTRSLEFSASCPGVDGNRNFDFQWMVAGASSNPCALNFAGLRPFSEPETRYLRDLVKSYEGRHRMYLSIHSHGSYFLYPYGYNGKPTPDNSELHSLGLKVAAAIDGASLPGSPKYLVGNSGAALNYLAAGASDDYTYGVSKIKLSYTLELPSGGNDGFDLPPSRIDQVVKETWKGMLVLARYIIDNPTK